ncbi:MAG: DUF4296 domain-containing protein [Saprospiraceae bacterium]
MSRRLGILIVLLFMFSCKNENDKLRISEDELRKVMFDIHTAEFIVTKTPVDIRDSIEDLYIDQIMTIHNIDRRDFEHDMEILRNNPERFEKFYEKLQEESKEFSKEESEKLKKFKNNQIEK